MIRVKQIDQAELSAFVISQTTGGQWSGNMVAYYTASGWFGPNVAYSSGGTQNIATQYIFSTSPEVPYVVFDTGSAVNYKLTIDLINSGLFILQTGNDVRYVGVLGNQIIGGYKAFSGQVQVSGIPINPNDVVNLSYLSIVSGMIVSGFGGGGSNNFVDTFSTQTISGVKIFSATPQSLNVPVNPTDIANKAYVDLASPVGVVYTTTDQTISGIKTFLQSPLVPIGTSYNSAVQKAQLDSVAISQGGISGFAGVIAINGQTGASGYVYIQGAGNVTVIDCSGIIYVSGNCPSNTQFYAAKIRLSPSTTGISYSFGNGFAFNPAIAGDLEVTGGNVAFIKHTLYNISTNGFNVAFESGMPTANYVFNFQATPLVSGSGFLGIQGPQGAQGQRPNSRGLWQIGSLYAPLDFVYQPPYNASFICTNTNISTSLNSPGGTGNGSWQIFMSGIQGATGIWNSFGVFDFGTTYFYGNSVGYNGSTYGYLGNTPSVGVDPSLLMGGWNLVAKQGDVGFFVNSGIITGNFVNLAFFINPVETGLDLGQVGVGSTFTATGYMIGCVQSGLGPTDIGGPLAGDLYFVDDTNNKTIFQSFTFNAGTISTYTDGISQIIQGGTRVGLDLTNTLSGIVGLSVSLFGF